jgi:hypothetical protein
MGIVRILGASNEYCFFSKMYTLNGYGQIGWHLSPPRASFLGFHMVGWKHYVQHDTLTMIGWTIVGRVHQKSSLGRSSM